jgi:hypothetical protein
MVVGGAEAVHHPPSATGREATLNDMIIWPSAMAIIGTQDACGSDRALGTGMDCTDMASSGYEWAAAGRKRGIQSAGCETNRSIPNLWERNLATSWPLTLLPALSSGGAKVPIPPLPGETVTMPPPIPLLPGRPMS